jgi:hypothetical protein
MTQPTEPVRAWQIVRFELPPDTPEWVKDALVPPEEATPALEALRKAFFAQR